MKPILEPDISLFLLVRFPFPMNAFYFDTYNLKNRFLILLKIFKNQVFFESGGICDWIVAVGIISDCFGNFAWISCPQQTDFLPI